MLSYWIERVLLEIEHQRSQLNLSLQMVWIDLQILWQELLILRANLILL